MYDATLKDINNAKAKTIEHMQILSSYLHNKTVDGILDNVPAMLREYADMIEHDIKTYETLADEYQSQIGDAN